jgi:hypothetical protein
MPSQQPPQARPFILPLILRSLDAATLPGAGFIPPDRAIHELQAQVKAAAWPRLAIDDSRRLREFACQGSNQRFFARPPEPLGHQPSAVGADVAREHSFGNTRFLRCYQVYGDRHHSALFNSPVEKHSTKIRRWSGVVHSSREFAQRNRTFIPLRVLHHPPSLSSSMPHSCLAGKP